MRNIRGTTRKKDKVVAALLIEIAASPCTRRYVAPRNDGFITFDAFVTFDTFVALNGIFEEFFYFG
jgi:hypothetical protein